LRRFSVFASTAAWRRATGRCSSKPTWWDVSVDRPACLESTALGAAFAAGWQAGLYPGPEWFAERRRRDRAFTPGMDEATRGALPGMAGGGEKGALTSDMRSGHCSVQIVQAQPNKTKQNGLDLLDFIRRNRDFLKGYGESK
jgi:hypothetical protein